MSTFILGFLIRLHGGLWHVKEGACAQGWRAKYLYRLYTFYLNLQGGYIGVSSAFAGPPVFPHGFSGVYISGMASLGRNCVIFHQVTIGTNLLPDSKKTGAPTVGDRCYIGAGAKIIGKIRIGNDVRIGANAVVVEDIPDNSLVVMDKPRVIERLHIKNRHYEWSPQGWFYWNDSARVYETDSEVVQRLEEAYPDRRTQS